MGRYTFLEDVALADCALEIEGKSLDDLFETAAAAIARLMVERVRKMVQGVQLSAPFGRYQMALDVAEAIGPR